MEMVMCDFDDDDEKKNTVMLPVVVIISLYITIIFLINE